MRAIWSLLLAAFFASESAAAAGSSTSPNTNVAKRAADAPKVGSPNRVRHALFLELLGNGGLYSINYDLRIPPGLSFRAGLSYFRAGVEGEGARGRASLLTVPVLVNALLGGAEHAVEVGAGGTLFSFSGDARVLLASSSTETIIPAATAFLGYRHTPRQGGLLVRVGFTPFLAFVDQPTFIPWGGMSLGGSF